MNIKIQLFGCVLFLLLSTANLPFLQAQEAPNDSINTIIRQQGMEQSQVMDIASWLMDVHGPRLTGSPKLQRAKSWVQDKLRSWDMQNVRVDEWGPFGSGWELEHFEMHARTPEYWPVLAYPKAWSPSTKGLIKGDVIYLQAEEEADLAAYKGKLAGKFVLLDTIRDITEWFEPSAKRNQPADLLALANAGPPTPRPRRNWQGTGGMSFNRILWDFLVAEKPACVLDRNYKGDLGTVFVTGARADKSEERSYAKNAVTLPQVTMAVEQYNRILRLINKGIPVELALEIRTRTTGHDLMESNILAEIPGTDKADELVIFGAHLDSWHVGTGATDNGAGSAVMMEVARILTETIRTSGIRPRRTLQLALWSGEEQGLLGSTAHVRKYYAETEPRSYTPKSIKPDQKRVSAYYNLDNGTGRIRGIYLQGNQQAGMVFRPWLNSFEDLEANTITMDNTGGTDHLGFDGAGIPGFQFIQDPVSYSTKTHHSNMDNYDHLIGDDLKQAATIIASFVWHTAMREEMIPRKPLSIDTVE
ncbi:MAG: M28 family peptidase [Saprospiraceae bacterium]|nr:M28 family peptidase [Saprospiraceae bacterium]